MQSKNSHILVKWWMSTHGSLSESAMGQNSNWDWFSIFQSTILVLPAFLFWGKNINS